MKIAILGFAGQGQSAYNYWNTGKHEMTICDRNEGLVAPEGAKTHLGDDYLKGLGHYDLLVRTPSLHPQDIVEANPETPDILQKVWSNTNEFMKVCPTKNIIGVTGTKGKGTTSTLIAKMLEADGKRVHLGGNIGIPPLELLKNTIQPDDWVVLELANFQLIDLKASPRIAVCLMVQQEHLDWHEDAEEYLASKQQLFMHQTATDIAIYYGPNDNSEDVAGASEGTLIPYFEAPGAVADKGIISIGGQEICKTAELQLLGKHNWQNVCAAITAVAQITQNFDAMRAVATSFAGLPYRLEFRGEYRGVKFYNDSFASQPEATIAAMESIPEKKIMIVGGYDRGLSVERLADALKKHDRDISKVILIGAATGRMTEMLEQKGFNNYVVSSSRQMKDIVRTAQDWARHGEAIVLSPGFASFDMFKNFEDRGQQFNDAVAGL